MSSTIQPTTPTVGQATCPTCGGYRTRLVVVPVGEHAEFTEQPCATCHGAGTVPALSILGELRAPETAMARRLEAKGVASDLAAELAADRFRRIREDEAMDAAMDREEEW